MCDSTTNLQCFWDRSPWALPATRHITCIPLRTSLTKSNMHPTSGPGVFLARCRHLAGMPQRSLFPYTFLCRSLISGPVASLPRFRHLAGLPQRSFPPYTFCYRSHISRPGASLARFRHLASLPQRSLFPYPFLRRLPNPGQALPCLDSVIWPVFPIGVCSLRHSVTDRSFPGQAPVWPDFGIWLAFPRGALSLAHSVTDRLFPGRASPARFRHLAGLPQRSFFPYALFCRLPIPGPGVSLIRFRHLAGVPQRSAFP